MDLPEVSNGEMKMRKRKRRRRSRVAEVKEIHQQLDHLNVRKQQSAGVSGPPLPLRMKRPQAERLACRMTVRKKNSAIRVHELRPGWAGMDVKGLGFRGRGPEKKSVKSRAAELARRSFVRFPEGIGSQFADGAADRSETFYADGAEPETWTCKPAKQCSPVALLGQLRAGLRYYCLTERIRGRPQRSFTAAVWVDGRIFEGHASSKGTAKARAAAAALFSFYQLGERKLGGLHSDKQQLPHFLAESIFQLVKQKYEQLMEQTLATHDIAAIVMTTGYEVSSAQVVAMATGTKCLDRDAGHLDEDVLRDCHAEVVCRRALLGFLYTQLEMLLIRPPDQTAAGSASIFEAATARRGVFRLQDRIGFHMFVTSSPCGDARLNCPYENFASPSRMTNSLRCGLRTKVSGGQGTLPIANQKRASVLPGKLQVSMSCTDKIAKWCAVGLQGALLSHLVEPIYLRSLTVATLSHTGHLRRVLARRLAPMKRHAAPYRRQLPLLACLGSGQRRAGGNSSRISLNWSHGDSDTEELAATSGLRRRCGTPSRLSGRHFFHRWQRLHRRLNDWTSEDLLRTHRAWKRAAVPYQKAVRHFGNTLRDAGLGTWSRKLTRSAQVDHIFT
ncbi:double-stranded RNA-specific editase B2-like [Corythoichthys intestinalis]|uniref:double-stranded RNA-specific editase B2-like n=1 Tax=Corythoichthys intestinalis TaxID=161448 RepID=UPI0025A660A5|nr:double-stranded RNA-specific editase B2-like [Corythoichthys intestinalis]